MSDETPDPEKERQKPVLIPESLHSQLRIKAANEGKKLREVVVPALEREVAGTEKEAA